MKNNTKIIVLHAKELIYAGILTGLAILLIIIIILAINSGKTETSAPVENETTYMAGVYKTSIMLNQTPVDVTVTVDSDHINSIEFVNLSETVATMYPLLQPCLETISTQICQKQSTADITYPEESRYTCSLLLEAINESLDKAKMN